jgi:GNAT superfamily N-acetyltransferase
MITIKKIEDLKGLRDFIQFRYDLYRDDPNDVPYLYSDEEFTLRHDKNASFDDCEADYFMAYRDGKPVGRVAAIINRKANERWQTKSVRFGWFDFIDDIEVSKALLDTVAQWGRERGMDKMIGPMGFADTDREGMLIEGFGEYSTAYANYNYDYYPRHMEQIGGFEKDNDWVQCQVKVPERVPEKFGKVAEMVSRRYNLKVHKLSRKELLKEGYGREVFQMLNICYGNLYGFASLGERKVDQLVDQYIRIADLNLVSIIVDGNLNNKMVGFGITFPSLSKAQRKLKNGKLLPFGWIGMLDAIKWHHADTVDMLLIGVLPEYRGKGANALIFSDLIQQYNRYGFKWAEAMPQMETNDHMLGQWQYLEANYHRRLRSYKKTLLPPSL